MVKVIFLGGATILIACSTLFFSCRNNTDVYADFQEAKLVEKKVVPIELRDENFSTSTSLQFYERNDTSFLMMADIDQRCLIEIDMAFQAETRRIYIEELKNELYYPVFLFHYIDEDSILILRDYSNIPNIAHDSLLFFVDFSGKTIGTVNLTGGTFPLKTAEYDSSLSTFSHHFSHFIIADDRLFIPTLPYFLYGNHEKIRHYDIPYLGYVDFREREHFFHLMEGAKKVMPRSDRSRSYAYEQNLVKLTALDKYKIVFSAQSERSMYLYDLENNTLLTEPNQEYQLITNTEPLRKISSRDAPQFNRDSPLFHTLLFDNQQHYILRFAHFAVPKNIVDITRDAYDEFRSNHQWIGVYDTLLNLLGEGYLPTSFQAPLLPVPGFKDSLFVTLRTKKDPHTVELVYHKLVLNKVNDQQLSSLRNREYVFKKERGLDWYFRSLEIPSESRLIFIPESSCPYCVKESLVYYMQQLKKMEEEKIYLFISEKDAKAYMTDTLARQSSHVITYEGDEFRKFVGISIDNPAVVFWNGEKAAKTIVLPPDLVVKLDSVLDSN